MYYFSRSLRHFKRRVEVQTITTWLVLVLPLFIFSGCEVKQKQKVELLDHDPYRDWKLGVSVDSRYRIALDGELTLLPQGQSYVLRATPELRGERAASVMLTVEEDAGSKLFIFGDDQNENLAESRLQTEKGTMPGIRSSLSLLFNAPSRGGHYVAAMEIRQIISQYEMNQGQRNNQPEKLAKIELQKAADVLLPTLSAEHFTDEGFVFGYEVGIYPEPKKSDKVFVRQNPQYYQRPEFFYRVDRETAGMKISDHFKLGQFDLDYDFLPGEFPQYIALDDRLIRKLELLIDRMNADGYEIETFEILAGFRSPKFNLGYKRRDEDFSLTETYSQHMYGRAVDLIVDRDNDGRMDDLDGNGRVTIDDARVILSYVDQIDNEALDGLNDLIGGAGVYYRHDIPDREIQTPYIHIDVRGFVNTAGRPMRWVGAK